MLSLSEKIQQLPLLPGCYLFKNKRGEIIYIGKSKALRNRVKQYFQNTKDKDEKIVRLVKEIVDFDYILTPTESEALILECTLIKKHKPHYNAALKKDKIFPYLKIDLDSEYPNLTVAYEKNSDAGEYFGCFYRENDVLQVVELINSVWQTPICNKNFHINHKGKACLHYHMKKCCAPCERRISPEEYSAKITDIVKFIHGKNNKIIPALKKIMLTQAQQMNFENAAQTRDKITKLGSLKRKAKRFNAVLEDKDVFVFFRAYNEQAFILFFIRNGEALLKVNFNTIENIDSSLLENFVSSILSNQFNIEDGSVLAKYIGEIGADKLYITAPTPTKFTQAGLIKLLTKGFCEFIHPS